MFSRGPLALIGIRGSTGGPFGVYDTLPAAGVITGRYNNSAGSGIDTTGYVLALGFGNADTDRYEDSQIVRSCVNDPILMAWRITNNGTAAIASGGSQASISRTGTGRITLTLTPARTQIRSAIIVAVNAAARAARILSFDGNTISISTEDAAGTVQDTDFILFVLCSGNTDETGRRRDLLRCPQLYPELVGGRVTVSGGVGTAAIGGATNGVDYTITNNGTGDYTINLVAPFLRAVLPIVTAKANRAQLLATPDTSSFRVGMFNAGGAAVDDDFDFICLGYNADVSQEF